MDSLNILFPLESDRTFFWDIEAAVFFAERAFLYRSMAMVLTDSNKKIKYPACYVQIDLL